MEIPGVPESVPWEKVRDFIVSLGLDPHEVCLGGIWIGNNAIECDVFAQNSEGRHYCNLATGEIARHRVTIEVDWGEDTPTRLTGSGMAGSRDYLHEYRDQELARMFTR